MEYGVYALIWAHPNIFGKRFSLIVAPNIGVIQDYECVVKSVEVKKGLARTIKTSNELADVFSSEESLNQTKIEAFGQKLLNILNHGAAGLMISIWHRTSLFDAMAQMSPATSEDIARSA